MQALMMRALDQSGPGPDRTVLFAALHSILVRTQALEVHRPGYDPPALRRTLGRDLAQTPGSQGPGIPLRNRRSLESQQSSPPLLQAARPEGRPAQRGEALHPPAYVRHALDGVQRAGEGPPGDPRPRPHRLDDEHLRSRHASHPGRRLRAFLQALLAGISGQISGQRRAAMLRKERNPAVCREKRSALGRTRTCGLLIRSQTLYPAELRALWRCT